MNSRALRPNWSCDSDTHRQGPAIRAREHTFAAPCPCVPVSSDVRPQEASGLEKNFYQEEKMSDEAQVQPAPTSAAAQLEEFGGWSRFLCVMGGIVAIGGGISLAGLRAASENNLFAAIANGIGWYCIGKGIFMLAIPFQAKGAVLRLLRR